MRIGTRRSRLAKAQAQIGRVAVQMALDAEAEIVELGTIGDAISARRPRGRWENTDGQFTGELEEALLNDAPSPSNLIEDLKIQGDAKRNLAAWKKPA